jgi:hypothetical protein
MPMHRLLLNKATTEPIPKLIFSCARPEPVEGYPRALEDILQQVQGEREKTKKHWATLMILAIDGHIPIKINGHLL